MMNYGWKHTVLKELCSRFQAIFMSISFGYPVILTTRRTFFYGILFMIPALFVFDFKIGLERFVDMAHLLNILYLGLGASALCFVT